MEKIMNSGISFYQPARRIHSDDCASAEARLILPLQSYAYGVPCQTFAPYYQMSPTFARDCCSEFDNAMIQCFQKEYRRLPTAQDIKNITSLHRKVHQVDGWIGSLDCTHTFWKNCPKAWAGSFKGKEEKPSLVLEAVADYLLFSCWKLTAACSG
jgi:Plant transposon protein